MKRVQYVCLKCGFNMVGFLPDGCPFCGAIKNHFITAEECSARFRLVSKPVNGKVTRLNTHPALGIAHSAYRIETGRTACWVDCPTSFDPLVQPADTILFTHHHFLGACNLYQELLDTRTRIHLEDSRHDICLPFTFDATYTENFVHKGIKAFHVDGHTPGFTFYIFEETLFICDYVFLEGDGMRFNPFGPAKRTVAGGHRIREILAGRKLSTVCGYNYVIGYDDWQRRFEALLPLN